MNDGKNRILVMEGKSETYWIKAQAQFHTNCLILGAGWIQGGGIVTKSLKAACKQ